MSILREPQFGFLRKTLLDGRGWKRGGLSAPAADATPPPVTKPDLTSWDFFWKMDEATGVTVNDTGTASGNNLVSFTTVAGGGSPAWATDTDMGGSVVDIQTNYTSTAGCLSGTSFNLGSSTQLTAVILVKPDTLGGASDRPTLFGQNDYNGPSDQDGWFLRFNHTNNGLYALFNDGGSGSDGFLVTHATAGISVGGIYCIELVFDGAANDAFLYVNGVLKGSDTTLSVGTIGGTTDSPLFRIGGDGDPTIATNAGYIFDGKIAWAAIDNVVHSGTDAANFYTALGL